MCLQLIGERYAGISDERFVEIEAAYDVQVRTNYLAATGTALAEDEWPEFQLPMDYVRGAVYESWFFTEMKEITWCGLGPTGDFILFYCYTYRAYNMGQHYTSVHCNFTT
jgi:hypothetical protein